MPIVGSGGLPSELSLHSIDVYNSSHDVMMNEPEDIMLSTPRPSSTKHHHPDYLKRVAHDLFSHSVSYLET